MKRDLSIQKKEQINKMSKNKNNQKYRLHKNALQIVFQYLPSIEDLMCVEFTCSKFKGIIESFTWNPIELKKSTKKHFPNLRELHLYNNYNDKFLDDKNITKRICHYEISYSEWIESEQFKQKNHSNENQKNENELLLQEIKCKENDVNEMKEINQTTTIDYSIKRTIQKYSINDYYKRIILHEKDEFTNFTSIPKEINELGYHCFESMKDIIEELILPTTITKINEYAFENFSELTHIELPSTLQSIGNYGFKNCTKIENLTIPDSVTFIGFKTFDNCLSLTKICIRTDWKLRESRLFNEHWHLSTFELPYRHLDINDTVAVGEDIDYLILSSNYISLEESCFENCVNLHTISLPSSLTSLGKNCFMNCVKLQSICVPNEILQIEENCFKNCSSLTEVRLSTKLRYLPEQCFSGCTALQYISIPMFVTKIDHNCFENCCSLTEIDLPYRLRILGNYTFHHCTSLQNIILPDSLKIIGDFCFSQCMLLSIPEIPISIKYVGMNCFEDCDSNDPDIEIIDFFKGKSKKDCVIV